MCPFGQPSCWPPKLSALLHLAVPSYVPGAAPVRADRQTQGVVPGVHHIKRTSTTLVRRRFQTDVRQLRLAGQLDAHQEGLTRVLRYRYNWQLRQDALRAVPDLRRPSRDLVDVLLGIVTDEHCDLQTRLLACDAVRHSIRRHCRQEGSGGFESEAFQCACEILRVPQPPVLREAVGLWLVLKREPVEQAAGA